MTENPLSVRSQVESIEIYEEDYARTENQAGHADIKLWLERGDTVIAALTMRIYFTRTDISLDDLTSSALNECREVMQRILERYESAPSGANPEQLWIQ